MKSKKIKKRLVLNKQTVADLGDLMMNHVHGGDTANSRCAHVQTCCTDNEMTNCPPNAIGSLGGEASCDCPVHVPPGESCVGCPNPTATCPPCDPGTEFVGCVAVD
ncbi:MAG: hypothetical protein GY950_28450 [bacterium]|nr:hypothetical protein [bacterium]